MIQHKPSHWLWKICSLVWDATDADLCQTPSILPTFSLYGPGEIPPEVHGSMFLLSFSNQISLVGHSSAVLSLAMHFYFNGTSFVRLTKKGFCLAAPSQLDVSQVQTGSVQADSEQHKT